MSSNIKEELYYVYKLQDNIYDVPLRLQKHYRVIGYPMLIVNSEGRFPMGFLPFIFNLS